MHVFRTDVGRTLLKLCGPKVSCRSTVSVDQTCSLKKEQKRERKIYIIYNQKGETPKSYFHIRALDFCSVGQIHEGWGDSWIAKIKGTEFSLTKGSLG